MSSVPHNAAGLLRLLAAALFAPLLASCSGGEVSVLFSADVRSNLGADGFITRTAAADNVFAAADNGAVFAGIDPATGDESRGFLQIPLDVPGGVTPGARVQTATLRVFVSRIDAPGPQLIPFTIELAAFQPPLSPGAFDNAAVSAVTGQVSFGRFVDNGAFKSIDVTTLLRDAIRLGVRNVGLRIRIDPLAVNPGLIVMEDTPVLDTAPHLLVDYFKS